MIFPEMLPLSSRSEIPKCSKEAFKYERLIHSRKSQSPFRLSRTLKIPQSRNHYALRVLSFFKYFLAVHSVRITCNSTTQYRATKNKFKSNVNAIKPPTMYACTWVSYRRVASSPQGHTIFGVFKLPT